MCDRCKPGWQQPECRECRVGFALPDCVVCLPGFLPPDCTSTCSDKNFMPPECTSCLPNRQPPSCRCPLGFGGADCNEISCSKVHDCNAAAQNAGLCIGPNVCHCLAGFSGDGCQTPPTLPNGWHVLVTPAIRVAVPIGQSVQLVADLLDAHGMSVLRQARPVIRWSCMRIVPNQNDPKQTAAVLPCYDDAEYSSDTTQSVTISSLGLQVWQVSMELSLEQHDRAAIVISNTTVVEGMAAPPPELQLSAYPSRVVSSSTQLVLTGTIEQQTVRLWQWSILRGQVDEGKVHKYDGAFQSAITLDPGAISSLNTTFLLTATLEDGTTLRAQIDIHRFLPPYGGSCEVIPNVGMELATRYRFTCSGWRSPYDHLVNSSFVYAVLYQLPTVSGPLQAFACFGATDVSTLDAYLPAGAESVIVRVAANGESTDYAVELTVMPYLAHAISHDVLRRMISDAPSYYDLLELYQIQAALAGQFEELLPISEVVVAVERLLWDFPPTVGTLAQYILTLDKLASNPTLPSSSISNVVPIVMSASKSLADPEYQHIPAQLALLQAISSLGSRMHDQPPSTSEHTELLSELWKAVHYLQWSMVRFVPTCSFRSALLVDSNSRISIRSGVDTSSVLQEANMAITDEFPASFALTQHTAMLLGVPEPTDCAMWYMAHVDPLFFPQPVPGSVWHCGQLSRERERERERERGELHSSLTNT